MPLRPLACSRFNLSLASGQQAGRKPARTSDAGQGHQNQLCKSHGDEDPFWHAMCGRRDTRLRYAPASAIVWSALVAANGSAVTTPLNINCFLPATSTQST